MDIKFKKLNPEAVIPKYGTPGAAGMDLTAISKTKVDHQFGYLMYIEYDTGLSVEIPEGYVGLIFPRSSCSNYGLSLANCVGVIDSDYRGSIKFRFKKVTSGPEYEVGDRVGQIIFLPFPKVNVLEVTELSDTLRGSGGYGSTGK